MADIGSTAGIKGIFYSFASKPQLEVKLQPLGVSLTDVPGIAHALRNLIERQVER